MSCLPVSGQIGQATSVHELEGLSDELLELATDTSRVAEHRQANAIMALALEVRALRWAVAGLPTQPESPSVIDRLETSLDAICENLITVEEAIDVGVERLTYGLPPASPPLMVRLVRWLTRSTRG